MVWMHSDLMLTFNRVSLINIDNAHFGLYISKQQLNSLILHLLTIPMLKHFLLHPKRLANPIRLHL